MSSSENLPLYVLDQIKVIANKEAFTTYSIDHHAGSEHGDGFMATMISVTVTGARIINNQVVSDVLKLICKMLPSNEARRNLFSPMKLFEREVYMYKTVLPWLTEFQKKKCLHEENGFFTFPKCYFAISNSLTDQHLIIMNDLRPSGYNLWNKLEPIGFENVQLVMSALGRLHGVSFVLRDKLPEEFEKLKVLDDLLIKMIDGSEIIQDLFNAGFDRTIKMFELQKEEKYLRTIRESWIKQFHDCVDGVDRFRVIGHGDCWNNNMMFMDRQKVCLIDWQLSRLGSPALDISYYLLSSTTKQLRDQYFDRFLQTYYTNLVEIVGACGCNTEEIFSFDDLQAQLQKFGKFGILMAPMLLQLIVSDPSNIVEMDEFAEELQANETREMTKFDSKSEKAYKDRISEVINDAIKYGWIE